MTTKFERFQVRLTTGQAGVDILTTDYDCPNSAPNTVLTRTTAVDVTPPNIVTDHARARRSLPPERSRCRRSTRAPTTTPSRRAPDTVRERPADLRPRRPAASSSSVTATDAGGNVGNAQAFYKVFTPVSFTGAFTTPEQAQLQTGGPGFGFPVEQAPGFGVYDPARCASRRTSTRRPCRRRRAELGRS